jgi:polysaccharide biosynthesis protein PslG
VYHGVSSFLGINTQLDSRGPAELDCSLGRMSAEDLGYLRAQLSWDIVQVTPHKRDFTFYDQMMAQLALHHLQWLPVVMAAPNFLDKGHKPQPNGFRPPAKPSQFGAFLKLLVQRYGPHGTFWRTYRNLPYDPIRAWQIWNEPSLYGYWEPRPSPAGYTALLRAAYRGIKSADPHALVVAAGVPFVAGIDFYNQMYKDGARRYFNVLGFNDYSSQVRFAEADLRLLRQTMDQHGDSRKPIWVSEFGWASAGPSSPFRAGSKDPRQVSRLLQFMVRNRHRLNIGKVFFYDWRDPPVRPINWWGVNMGMYRQNGTQRPVANVIVSAARRLNH